MASCAPSRSARAPKPNARQSLQRRAHPDHADGSQHRAPRRVGPVDVGGPEPQTDSQRPARRDRVPQTDHPADAVVHVAPVTGGGGDVGFESPSRRGFRRFNRPRLGRDRSGLILELCGLLRGWQDRRRLLHPRHGRDPPTFVEDRGDDQTERTTALGGQIAHAEDDGPRDPAADAVAMMNTRASVVKSEASCQLRITTAAAPILAASPATSTSVERPLPHARGSSPPQAWTRGTPRRHPRAIDMPPGFVVTAMRRTSGAVTMTTNHTSRS